MLSESIRCLDERVVDSAWAVDLAMVLGTGFAPHRGGPLHLIDAIGHDVLLDNLTRLQATLGDRFAAPQSLQNSAARGENFFDSGPSSRSAASTSP